MISWSSLIPQSDFDLRVEVSPCIAPTAARSRDSISSVRFSILLSWCIHASPIDALKSRWVVTVQWRSNAPDTSMCHPTIARRDPHFPSIRAIWWRSEASDASTCRQVSRRSHSLILHFAHVLVMDIGWTRVHVIETSPSSRSHPTLATPPRVLQVLDSTGT